jgi:DNA-binding transcriptional MerR regulator
MLRPLKRSGGRRYYRPEDVTLVETIDRLINREGYTLKGARQAIERGQAPSATPASAAPAVAMSDTRPDILPQLRAIRERLAHALAA